MKTFEEGEWLAYDADMWMVKEIEQDRIHPGVNYNISNGAVETWINPVQYQGRVFKLTLPIRNAVDSFQCSKRDMHKKTPAGANWPDLHREYVRIFNKICQLYEEYDGDFENKEFQSKSHTLWEEFQEFEQEIKEAINKIKSIQVGRIQFIK